MMMMMPIAFATLRIIVLVECRPLHRLLKSAQQKQRVFSFKKRTPTEYY